MREIIIKMSMHSRPANSEEKDSNRFDRALALSSDERI